MIQITGGKKEQLIRGWLNTAYNGTIPRGKVLDIHRAFISVWPDSDVSYSSFNGVLKRVESELETSGKLAPTEEATGIAKLDSVVKPQPIKVEDMEFPSFDRFRTGKKLDDLFSDHEPGGGLYGGTVNIVVGESGVGKSTVMLDLLASIQDTRPEAKVLYVSSEMTRNDILFYYKKTPSIGKVPTLLLMDWVKSGQLSGVLEQAFNGEYDIILLDSYQDVLVKLKEVHGWRSTYAESWLTNMMIDAAEKNGCAVLAIQHMTKGGQYVGSTYLKHATTAMMEIRFDLSGHRYIEFSKNRRGGSAVGKRLYYRLNESGQVEYDVERYEESEEMRAIENRETVRQHELSKRFEEIFLGGKKEAEQELAVPIKD